MTELQLIPCCASFLPTRTVSQHKTVVSVLSQILYSNIDVIKDLHFTFKKYVLRSFSFCY